MGTRLLDRQFRNSLRSARDASTVAYFWPDPPIELVREAQARGITTVREMINTACATSGPILDEAYRSLGIEPTHTVTPEKIRQETKELRLYDYIFASNPEVESSLRRLGIPESKIIQSTFGWNPQRFHSAVSHAKTPRQRNRRLQFLFVGTLSIRKGVVDLLSAWSQVDIDGELVLVGSIDPDVEGIIANGLGSPNVRHIGFTDALADLYQESDVFIFPTLEEGGPQVTYEAASFGLPIITTAMGAARLVESGESGVLVDPGAVDQLCDAIQAVAGDAHLRARYGAEAKLRAEKFTYDVVGARRARQLAALVGE